MTSDLAMVDAHVHFWDPARHYYPWLCDRPLIPFRYGDYSAICRRYLPADYLADARPHNVVKAVYLEAEWDPRDPIGEMDFIADLRRDTGFPTVAIAQAWRIAPMSPKCWSITHRAISCAASARSRAAARLPRTAGRPA